MQQQNQNSLRLSELKAGQQAKIVYVGGEGATRKRLLDMGLTPKTNVKLVKFAPMNDPIEISLRGYELSLRLEDAQYITVELLEENR